MVQLKIKRQDGEKIWYETFDVYESPKMSVLEALFYVQERLDGSLCFRYSCRGAVCGSCAMLINRIPRLACRTQVSEVKNELTADIVPWGLFGRPVSRKSKEEILIEPLPNLAVIRDLVVDMEYFYELLDSIEPWIETESDISENHLMNPATVANITSYANCILCAVCHGACPVAARTDTYVGPAVIAKVWRFHLDPRERDERKRTRLEDMDSFSGVWGCDTVYKCSAVCPKQVTPTQAITGLRRSILMHRIRNIFRRRKK